MDVEKFNVLAALVREAKANDKEAFDKMQTANAEWKSANEVLTSRLKVFDDFVASQKSEAISV